MLMHTRHVQPLQRAFTLVEMIIAMVILAVVMAIAGGVITNSFQGSNKSVNERSAVSSVARSMASLESAMRSTKSSDRDASVLPSTGDLSGALLNGRAVEGRRTANSAPTTLDVRDVLYADGNKLVVRADVLTNPGVECVMYLVAVVPGAQDRSLTEYIWAGAAPGAAPSDCSAFNPPTNVGPAPLVTKRLISTVGNG